MAPPRDSNDSGSADKFIGWLREDVRSLKDSVDKLATVVANLEVKIAPILNYEQPCKALLELQKQFERQQSWWSKLAFELTKMAIIAGTSALIALYAYHKGGK